MNCPSCAYQSQYEALRCPQCRVVFDAGALETLGHLVYLRERLARWRAEGVIAPEDADDALESTEQELNALAARLALAPAHATAVPEVAPVAASVGMVPPAPPAIVMADQPPVEATMGPATVGAGPAELLVTNGADEPIGVAGDEPIPAPTAGPSFAWRDIGTYLLSERTLHGLLGLGAFLILASGVVISTLNPTGLGPLWHLGAVVATTLLFFAAGAFVHQRMRLTIAGATLLGIAGAFVPLTIWTLGQRQLLNWETGAIWLVASLVSLPLYLAAQRLLRGRTFALLAALAAGSEVLATANWLGIPLEWGLAGLVLLAIGYQRLARRLHEDTSGLSWALTWTAEAAVPVLMVLLLFGRLGSDAWLAMVGRPLSAYGEYAIGAGWWLGVLFYVQGARLVGRRWHLYAAAWTLPVAYLLTLTRAPWEPSWYNACLAVLAAGYLVAGARRTALTPQAPLPHAEEGEQDHLVGAQFIAPSDSAAAPASLPSYGRLALDPFIQVMLALAIFAAFWPPQIAASRIATLALLAGLFAASAGLLRVRLPGWVGVLLLGIAYGEGVRYFEVPGEYRALAWSALGAILLAAGEIAVRRTGEADRSLLATVFAGPNWGRSWQARLAAPLFAGGYVVCAIALSLALGAYGQAPASAGLRRLTLPVVWGFAAVLAALAVSSVARRTGFFLYFVAWLALIPLTAGAAILAEGQGWSMREPELARVLAGVSFVWLLLAWLVDRGDGRYARPLYLAGYLLLPGSMLVASLNREASLHVVGFGVLVYALSAWLAHTERLPSFERLVERLSGSATSDAARGLRAFWLYLAAWLLPIWALVVCSLQQPTIIWYALVLSGLALVYPLVGLGIGRIRREYRWPWYLGGYALSAIAPLVALTDLTYRPVVLGLSIALYVATAIVGRRSAWLYPVAILVPVLLWQSLGALGWFERWYGIGLVALGLVYGVVGLVLHRVDALTPQPSLPHADEGEQMPRERLPIGERIGAYGLPFLVVGYALGALGLARAANQERELAALAFVLGAVQHAASALIFRQPLFGWVTAALVAAAYVLGLTLTPLDPTHRGLGLLPGGLLMLLISEGLRRVNLTPEGAMNRAPTEAGLVGAQFIAPSRTTAWSVPWLIVAVLAAISAPPASTVDQRTWMLAWTGSTLLFAAITVLLRYPLWLFPTFTTGTVAFLAAGYLVDPTMPSARSFATLSALAWVFLGAAWLLERWRPATARAGAGLWAGVRRFMAPDPSERSGVGQVVRDARASLGLWPVPLHIAGWATLLLACIGSLPDAMAALWATGAVAMLLVALTVLRGSAGYAWLSVAVTLLASEHGLRVAGIPWMAQPPYWAGTAFAAVLLSEVRRVRTLPALALWSRPLRWSSAPLAVVAVIAALLIQADQPTREGVQRLALAVALAGLTAVGHAFILRERRLVYLGVALLEGGLMLELLFFEVGQPQAFALPAGLYLLAVAYFEWRRGTVKMAKRALEIGALAVLLGVSLIQAIGFLGDGHDRYVYATFLLVECAALLALGAVLRWRYTFFLAALALVIDVGILLADPLRALNTWYLVALIGLVLIGGVIWIERQRQKIPLWLESWRARLEQWD